MVMSRFKEESENLSMQEQDSFLASLNDLRGLFPVIVKAGDSISLMKRGDSLVVASRGSVGYVTNKFLSEWIIQGYLMGNVSPSLVDSIGHELDHLIHPESK